MPRYVLRDASRGALLIAEAPSEHDALLWGFRHLSQVPGFDGLVEPEVSFDDPMIAAFRARYVSEGETEEDAQKMAEIACEGQPRLRVVQVAAQDPMLRS